MAHAEILDRCEMPSREVLLSAGPIMVLHRLGSAGRVLGGDVDVELPVWPLPDRPLAIRNGLKQGRVITYKGIH